MEKIVSLDGTMYAKMLNTGAVYLNRHVDEVNDLNVFPIPDGDTGNNMLMTMMGGVNALTSGEANIAQATRTAADGMLLSARGNSGVILSQLFDGIAAGLEGVETADLKQLEKAMHTGVEHAYKAVVEPTEGTILTVARCAADYADESTTKTVEEYFVAFEEEAARVLEKTPDMLPVLKKAGVVDSGGAGLTYIVEGMIAALKGQDEKLGQHDYLPANPNQDLDFDLFTEDSVLEYGYCTEVLLRLQNAKTDIEAFDVDTVSDFLQTIGNSVVAVKTGSAVKVHVHTMTPDKVLAYCQQYGEFLTIKIENMSLQHNNTLLEDSLDFAPKHKVEEVTKKVGIVTCCSGEGVKDMFLEQGADVVVDGGQTMNPSTEDFLQAFAQVNAENIIVMPNNSNIFLAAKQAGNMYEKAEVRVLESSTIGEGYVALTMLDPNMGTIDEIMDYLQDAMSNVLTVEVSKCIRNAEIDGVKMHTDDYISINNKECVAVNPDRLETVCETLQNLHFENYDVCILICGKNATSDEVTSIKQFVKDNYRYKEVYDIAGKQEVYDYILILQ